MPYRIINNEGLPIYTYYLSDTLVDADLSGADLCYANLHDADLRRVNLHRANVQGSNLRGANMRGSNLRYTDMNCADLSGADISHSDARSADMYAVNLRVSDLHGSDMRGADMRGANLCGANLRDADLRGADLRGADLRGADLAGANVSSANMIGSYIHVDVEPTGVGSGAPTKTKYTTFTSKRRVGVEWEYNNNSCLNTWCDKWTGSTIHEDGSCGWEAVTAPLSGDSIRRCLTQLSDAFEEQGTRCNERCGVHVHVDAHDITWSDMYRLLWVYERLEPMLYLIAGQKRAFNTYSLKCGKDYFSALSSIDRKGAVLAAAYRKEEDNNLTPTQGRARAKDNTDKKNGGRYKGLNIVPWLVGRKKKATDTTLEFRMHRNTLDAERVINWAEMCALIVDWCVAATDKEAQDLPKSSLRALAHICPSKVPWILKRIKAYRADAKPINRYISLRKGQYTIISSTGS